MTPEELDVEAAARVLRRVDGRLTRELSLEVAQDVLDEGTRALLAELEQTRGHNEALYQQWLDVQDADNTWERYGLSCHSKWLTERAENERLSGLYGDAVGEREEAYRVIGEQAEAMVEQRAEYLALAASRERAEEWRDVLMAEVDRCVEVAPNEDARTAYQWIRDFIAKRNAFLASQPSPEGTDR